MWTASWEYFSQETVSKAETQSPRNLVREAEPLQAPENLWTEGWKWITEKVEYISQEAVVPKAKTGPPRTTVREPQPDSESSSRAQYQDAGSVARNVYGTVRNTVGHYVPGAVSAAVTDGEQEKNTDAEKSWKLDLLLWWIGYDPNAPHPLVRYVGIIRNEGTVKLSSAFDFTDFSIFTRNAPKQYMFVCVDRIVQKIKPGERDRVIIDFSELNVKYAVHLFCRPEGITAVAVTVETYDEIVAQGLLRKICDEFITKYPRSAYANFKHNQDKDKDYNLLSYPELEQYLKTWQKPEDADNLKKIQKELDDTIKVMHKTIDSVLERGEKLEDLVAKSDGLSAQSKLFYTQAKKQNSCCSVM